MLGLGRGCFKEDLTAELRHAYVRLHLLGGEPVRVEGRLRRSFGELHDIPYIEIGKSL